MEERLGRALVAWIHGVRRRARGVLVATAVLTLVALVFTVAQLGVNTHHTAILSDDMPFWKDYHEFAEVFPILDESLLVVVDGETPGAARQAAVELGKRLAETPELYREVYVPGGDPFFERHALLYLDTEELQDLGDQLAGMQPLMAEVARDSSLGNMATVLREGIERVRADPEAPVDLNLAFDSVSRAAEAVLSGNPRPISWTELILRRKLPGDTVRRLLVLEPVYDYDHLLPGLRAIEGVREAAAELGLSAENGVTVRITGNVALNTEEMLGMARGSILATLASLALVAVILAVAMRSTHLVLSALITLLVSLVWTAGIAALGVGHVNVVSVCFAVLMIGLGIDFGIHFGMRYAELLRADAGHEGALEETARSVGGSLVLCALTTAMAFFVFIPTDYKAVGELGLISGVGMLVSLFCSLTVLPALLTVWRERHPGAAWGGALWFERLVITSAHHPRTVRLVAALLGLGSLAALPMVHFDHNVARLRDPTAESVQTIEELLEESDTAPWTMDVMAPDLETAAGVASRLRQLDVVERAVTLADYVPEDQEEKLEILAEVGYFVPEPPRGDQPPAAEVSIATQIATLQALRDSMGADWLAEGPAERAASAQRASARLDAFLRRLERHERKSQQREELAQFERSLTGALPDQMRRLWVASDPDPISLETLPASLARRMVAPGGQARVEVLPSQDLNDSEAHAHFVDTVKLTAPEATGSAVTLLEFGRAVVRTFRQALLSAIVIVGVLLWILWRRLGDMALVVAPLALALLLTTATAGILGISFNFANVVVLPLLLGIGVDSGIHLVHRHRVTIETTGHAQAPERELLETSTAQAVFFSALTTMASFGSLALAGHRGFASLGQLLLIGMVFTLLSNLVVLPALIAWRGVDEEPDDRAEATV